MQTKGNTEVIDITSQVADRVRESGAKDGTVTVFVPGSTAGVSTIEYEGGLVADIHSVWERIAPREIPYRHDAAWGDGNGHSHIRSFLLGPSLVVPFVNRRLTLGTWQQIVLVDFDNRPRSRDIVVQIMGD
ncbi:MAG: YjbQ family protein [Dehalococcoidia bacterium]|nr:YjbQ family protein [Dehalococcoidia bacterium]